MGKQNEGKKRLIYKCSALILCNNIFRATFRLCCISLLASIRSVGSFCWFGSTDVRPFRDRDDDGVTGEASLHPENLRLAHYYCHPFVAVGCWYVVVLVILFRLNLCSLV